MDERPISELLPLTKSVRALVMGDAILDRYVHGAVTKVNPEAPGVVFQALGTRSLPGGAGGVARMLAAWGCETVFAGTVGDDQEGVMLETLLDAAEIKRMTIRRGTTSSKERQVADGRLRQDRVDREAWLHLSDADGAEIAKGVASEWRARRFDLIILSDYDKGGLTRGLIQAAVNLPAPVVADPGLGRVDLFRRAMVLKLNRREAEREHAGRGTGLGVISCLEDATRAAADLTRRLSCAHAVVTMDGDGMAWEDGWLPSVPRQEVYDVTGAGDAVAVALGIGVASGFSFRESCRLAAFYAGLQVTRLGVHAFTFQELLEAAG